MVKNADSFLTSFVHMYKANKNVRDSLLIGMVQAMIAKLSGHPNPEYSVIVMIFFIGLDAKSRRAHNFATAYLFGPSLRAIQRKNAKTRDSNIIQCDIKNVRERVGRTLDKVYSDTGKDQSFSLSFDGTKTPKKLQLSTAYKAVVGGIVPRHLIDISETSEADVRALLAMESDVVRAAEVKVCVMTLQSAPSRMSPKYENRLFSASDTQPEFGVQSRNNGYDLADL